MPTSFVLLFALFSSAASLQLPHVPPRASVAPPCMRMPCADDVIAQPTQSQSRADEPSCFFGGGNDVPEGAKCIFRPNAPCNRKRCQVNNGPCKGNHASK